MPCRLLTHFFLCVCVKYVCCAITNLCVFFVLFFLVPKWSVFGGKKVGDTVVAGFDVAIVVVIAMHNTISLPMPAPGLLPYA